MTAPFRTVRRERDDDSHATTGLSAEVEAEREARIPLYTADVQAGRRIRYIPSSIRLVRAAIQPPESC